MKVTVEEKGVIGSKFFKSQSVIQGCAVQVCLWLYLFCSISPQINLQVENLTGKIEEMGILHMENNIGST